MVVAEALMYPTVAIEVSQLCLSEADKILTRDASPILPNEHPDAGGKCVQLPATVLRRILLPTSGHECRWGLPTPPKR